MNRGDIYSYQSLGRTKLVLLVSSDEWTEQGAPMTCELTEIPPSQSTPRGLLATPIPGHGHVVIRTLGSADPARFIERRAVAESHVMDQVDMALRAALDLL